MTQNILKGLLLSAASFILLGSGFQQESTFCYTHIDISLGNNAPNLIAFDIGDDRIRLYPRMLMIRFHITQHKLLQTPTEEHRFIIYGLGKISPGTQVRRIVRYIGHTGRTQVGENIGYDLLVSNAVEDGFEKLMNRNGFCTVNPIQMTYEVESAAFATDYSRGLFTADPDEFDNYIDRGDLTPVIQRYMWKKRQELIESIDPSL